MPAVVPFSDLHVSRGISRSCSRTASRLKQDEATGNHGIQTPTPGIHAFDIVIDPRKGTPASRIAGFARSAVVIRSNSELDPSESPGENRSPSRRPDSAHQKIAPVHVIPPLRSTRGLALNQTALHESVSQARPAVRTVAPCVTGAVARAHSEPVRSSQAPGSAFHISITFFHVSSACFCHTVTTLFDSVTCAPVESCHVN